MEITSRPRPSRERLVEARIKAGLTQGELASAVGCSVFSIGKYERGERSPGGPILRKLADVTGRTVSWFFSENGAEGGAA